MEDPYSSQYAISCLVADLSLLCDTGLTGGKHPGVLRSQHQLMEVLVTMGGQILSREAIHMYRPSTWSPLLGFKHLERSLGSALEQQLLCSDSQLGIRGSFLRRLPAGQNQVQCLPMICLELMSQKPMMV